MGTAAAHSTAATGPPAKREPEPERHPASAIGQKQNIGSYNLEFALKNIPVGLYLMLLNNENSTDNIKLIIK